MLNGNSIRWRDIVLIRGEYHLEEEEISLEDSLKGVEIPIDEAEILAMVNSRLKEEDPLYNCDMFFDKLVEEYNLSSQDEVQTYLFDGIFLPEEVTKKWDIALLGGYINQYNI